jgi:hypothetical protein
MNDAEMQSVFTAVQIKPNLAEKIFFFWELFHGLFEQRKSLKWQIIRDIISCSSGSLNPCFAGIYRLHVQCRKIEQVGNEREGISKKRKPHVKKTELCRLYNLKMDTICIPLAFTGSYPKISCCSCLPCFKLSCNAQQLINKTEI